MEEENYNCEICFDDESFKGCYACADDEYTEEDKEAYLSIPIDNVDNSYYGRLSNDQPDVGVIYQMLDVHIEKMVNKYGQKFNADLKKVLQEHKKSIKEMIDKVSKSNSLNSSEVRDLKKKVWEQDKLIQKCSDALADKDSTEEETKEMVEIKASLVKKGIIKEKKE